MSTCPYGASVKPGFDPATYVPVDISVFSVVSIVVPWWWNALSFAFFPAEMLLSELAALNPDDPPDPNFWDVIAALDQKNPIAALAVDQWIKAKLTYLLFTHYCVCNADGGSLCTTGSKFNGSHGGATQCWNLISYAASGYEKVLSVTGSNGGSSDGGSGYTLSVALYLGATHVATPISLVGAQNANVSGSADVTAYNGTYDTIQFNICGNNPGAGHFLVNGTLAVTSCNPTPGGAPPGGTTYTQPPTLTPPAPQTGCSLDDVCAELFRIEQKINSALATATLLQRWELPFGYMLGAAHSGLAGSGSFLVSRLLGFLVQVTTPPPGGRVLPGNPPYLWDAGWTSINDTGGMLEEKRVTRSGYVWLPGAAALATSFNYALDPGVVLRVQELEAEA